MKFYKIKHLPSGKFFRGGSYPDFSDNGKSWVRLNDVKYNLSHYRPDDWWYGAVSGKEIRNNCTVREYIIDEENQEITINDINIKELMGWND